MADYSVALGIQPQQGFDASRAFSLAAQLKGQEFNQEQELRRQAFAEAQALHSQKNEDARLGMAQSEASKRNSLLQLQLDQARGGQNALAEYSKDTNAPGAVDKLARYPDIQSQVLAVRGQLSEADKQQFDQKLIRNGRRAQYVSGFEGDAKKQAWAESLKEAKEHGDITDQQYQQFSASEPNDLLLHNVMAQAMPIQEIYKEQQPTPEMRNLKAAGIDPKSPQGRAALTGVVPKFEKTSDGRLLRTDPVTGEVVDMTPPRADGSTGPVGAISDDTAADLAKRYNMGETDVLNGLGSRDVGNVNRAKVLQMAQQQQQESGLTPEQIFNRRIEFGGKKAAERSRSTQESKMEIAAAELDNLIPLGRDAMAKLPRAEFLPWNKLVEAARNNIVLSPAQAAAKTATQGIINAYAAVIGRGNATVSVNAQHHAEALLNTAYDQDTYNAVLDMMQRETKAAVEAPETARDAHRARSGGAAPPPAASKIKVNSADEARQLIQSGQLKKGDHFTDENGIDRVVH